MTSRKLVVAHAGGASAAPPNTLEAFETAIRLGADMIEFDVRRTRDDELVLYHDEAIGDRPLSTLTYADVLRLVSPRGHPIPRFGELLDAAYGRVRLDIELKEAGYEARLLRLVFDRGFGVADFVVTSFEADALAQVKRVRPEVRTGFLVYDVTGQRALELFQGSGADFLGPDCQILDAAILREAAAAGVALLPWTVNDPTAIGLLLDAPAVMGVITDHTADALRIRNAKAATASAPGP
jgi:glycerophosphoryl diester phosphodiesterase